MRKATFVVVLTTLMLSSASIARAFTLPFIPWIPDICVSIVGHCIQFTQVTALAQLQTVLTELENLKNLHGFNGIVGGLIPQARMIYAQIHSALPTHVADAGAATMDKQSPDTSNHIDAANEAAKTATGALAATNASNLYLSTIASEVQTSNQVAAAKVEQDQSVTNDLAKQLEIEGSGEVDGAIAP